MIGYITLVNIITFIVYGIDKRKAVKGKWRIPESVLIGMAIIGGGAGALLGMLIWHHKTRKWKFRILVPLFLALWVAFLGIRIYSNIQMDKIPEMSAEECLEYTLAGNDEGIPPGSQNKLRYCGNGTAAGNGGICRLSRI